MMIYYKYTLSVSILMTLVVSFSYAAGNTVELKNNPFTRPGFLTSNNSSSFVANTGKGAALDIRATMADGENSLVNLGGTIIKIGEEINGFKLLSVTEEKVIFSKNNAIVSVMMNRTWLEN